MSLILPEAARTESARERIASLAAQDTYTMAGVVGFYDITPGLHMQMSRWIDGPSRRKLGLVPRDHLKTSIWTIANSVRRIVADPNIRILIGNETATNASHFLRRIEAVFDRNTLFQWLYPHLIPDAGRRTKWSEVEMLVPRSNDYPESTVESIGVGGAVVSRHYKLIKLDDLVGKEASESDEVMKKTIDWLAYAESLLESPQDEIQVYGTRWAWHDVYAWLEQHERNLDKFYRQVYGPDGAPIWPERFDAQSLDDIRYKIGSFKFSCQYLNKPHDPESTSFDEKWLRYYERFGEAVVNPNTGTQTPIAALRITARCDPAISEKAGAARSAIIVDGVAADERVYVLEAWAKRVQPFEMIEKLFEFQEQYNLESIGIESVAYQRILKPVIERECERRGIWINVVELKPDSRERKFNRIRGKLQPSLERGLIWVRTDMQDLLDEYRMFPNGPTVDLLDALAYGEDMWSKPFTEEEDAADREAESDFDALGGRDAITGY